MKRLFLFALPFFLAALWWLVPALGGRPPAKFEVSKLIYDLKPESVLPYIPENNALAQSLLGSGGRYTYLGHGTQAMAFESPDGKYVLKLFSLLPVQKKKYRLPSPLRLWPPYQEKKIKKNEAYIKQRLYKLFRSYALAFDKMKDDTGLLCMHVHPTEGLFPPCTVVDNRGIEHMIDLDRVVFALQEKATLVPAHLAQARNPEEYQKGVAAILELFERRAKKGLYEFKRDFPLEKNYGFVGDRVIFLDPGRITYSAEIEKDHEKELADHRTRLEAWLLTHAPFLPL